MKWVKKKYLKAGDTKREVKFAWLPRYAHCTENGVMYKIWLEKYYVDYIYQSASLVTKAGWFARNTWVPL